MEFLKLNRTGGSGFIRNHQEQMERCGRDECPWGGGGVGRICDGLLSLSSGVEGHREQGED